MKYDLSLLTDIEFQKLINQLVQKQYSDKTVEEYCEGPDSGKDGLIHLSSTEIKVIQSKHYLKTGFSGLYNKIEKSEIKKIIKLNPKEYVLATSIDLSAEQSKKIEDLIKNNVSNTRIEIWGYSTIESLLDENPDIVKATIKLWAQNVDVIKHILNPEAETSFMCLQTRWKKIDKYFVSFEKVQDFIKKLNQEHVLIISGEPGIGKTTLAEYLCKTFFADGFKIEIIDRSNLAQRIDLTNSKEKILFYFDDFLGSNYFSDIDGSFDRQLVDILREVKAHKNKRFVLTSRTNIIEKGDYLSQEFAEYHLKDVSIPIMSVDLNDEVKATILYNHLWHSQLDQETVKKFVDNKNYQDVVSHKNFNPRLIEFITEKKNYEKSEEDYITFVKKSLDNPKAVWEKCYSAQLNESQRALIKLVVANEGKIEENLLINGYNKARDIFPLTPANQERMDYPYVFDICQNSILKCDQVNVYNFDRSKYEKKRYVSTFNPSVNDFIIPLIKNSFELERLFKCLQSLECIRFICSLEFDYKIGLLLNILNSLTEYTTIKLVALRGLLKLSYENAKKYLLEIVEDQSLGLSKVDDIVIEYIDKVDFSSFIEKNINDYIASVDDIHNLYEQYSKSSFCKEDVLNKIYDKLSKTFEEDICDILNDDDDFNECFTVDEGYNRLDEILRDFPCLKTSDQKRIRESIDMSAEIEKNNEQFYEPDYDSYDSYQSERPSNAFDIGSLFNGLLNR